MVRGVRVFFAREKAIAQHETQERVAPDVRGSLARTRSIRSYVLRGAFTECFACHCLDCCANGLSNCSIVRPCNVINFVSHNGKGRAQVACDDAAAVARGGLPRLMSHAVETAIGSGLTPHTESS